MAYTAEQRAESNARARAKYRATEASRLKMCEYARRGRMKKLAEPGGREHLRELAREWKKKRGATREGWLLLAIGRAKSRATLGGFPFALTSSSVELPDFCPYLGVPLIYTRDSTDTRPPGLATLDKIVPEKGYVDGNVLVVSHRANRLKSDATPDELEFIAAHMRRLTCRT